MVLDDKAPFEFIASCSPFSARGSAGAAGLVQDARCGEEERGEADVVDDGNGYAGGAGRAGQCGWVERGVEREAVADYAEDAEEL